MLISLLLVSQLTLATDTAIRVDFLPAEPWAVGQRLFVAGHEVNLRAAASTDAPVVRELDLGTPVTITAVLADGVEVGGREGRWYAVEVEGTGQQGSLFGGVLTPARLEADLDQDGEKELAVLTWGWDKNSVIRILEPNLSGADAVTQLDLGQTNDIEGPQVEMYLGVTTVKETGIPLLKVILPGREMCGSGSFNKYVSYRSTDAGMLGTLRLAIEDHSYADAPVYSRRVIEWAPSKPGARVTETMGNDDEGTESEEVTHYLLRDGVFVALKD